MLFHQSRCSKFKLYRQGIHNAQTPACRLCVHSSLSCQQPFTPPQKSPSICLSAQSELAARPAAPRASSGLAERRGRERSAPARPETRGSHTAPDSEESSGSRGNPKAPPSTNATTAHPDPCISTKYRDRSHTLLTQQAAAVLQTGFFHQHGPFCWLNLSQVPKEIATVKSILKFPKKRTGAAAHLVHA